MAAYAVMVVAMDMGMIVKMKAPIGIVINLLPCLPNKRVEFASHLFEVVYVSFSSQANPFAIRFSESTK